ncbi:MAG: NAD(P)H-binding protein [Bryobacterales bacterium]|nr:NAD(P)H-binding protein [Bryobacterales bacterium]
MRRRCAVIAGASGLVGRSCLDALLASDHYSSVVALLRRPLDIVSPKLVQRVVSFDRIEPAAELPEGVAFCALGTTIRKAGSQEAFRKVDFEYAVNFAKWARQGGASRFVLVSSVDASSKSSNFYLRVKGEVEDAVRGLGFETVHILRPSFLLGDRGEERLGERMGIAAAKAMQFALLGGLRRYRPVEASAVAAAMSRAGLREETGVHIWRWQEISNG